MTQILSDLREEAAAIIGSQEIVNARGGYANLDARLDADEADIDALETEVTAARGAYGNLDSRMSALAAGGGTVVSAVGERVISIGDYFTNDIAAGSVDGTTSTTGGATRDIIDTGGNISISGKNLVFAGGATSYTDTGIIYDGISRGNYVDVNFTAPATNQTLRIGLSSTDGLPGNGTSEEEAALFCASYGGTRVFKLAYNGYIEQLPFVYTASGSYSIRFKILDTGFEYWMRGEEFGNEWKFMLSGSNNVSPILYPFIQSYNAAFSVQSIEVWSVTSLSESVETLNRRSLRSWSAAVSTVLQTGAGNAHVAVLSDSWSVRTTNALRAFLQSEYGDAGPGFIQFGASQTDHIGTIARTGTWTNSDEEADSYGVGIQHVASTDASTPAKISFSATFTDGAVHYIEQSGGGDFRYRVDGGTWQTVDTAAGATAFASVTTGLTGLSDVSHTVEIEMVAADTNGVILTGFLATGDDGVIVSYCGNAGLAARHVVAVDADIWQDGLTALNPDVLIILLGTNDQSDGVDAVTPAIFGTQLETIIDRARAAVPLVDILLLSPFDNNSGGTSMSEYDLQMYTIANANEYSFVSGYRLIPSYADGNSRGMYQDSIHPSLSGYMLLANAVARFMRER